MASTARMREIVPGLFLGNVKASYNQGCSEIMWVWWNSATRKAGIPEARHKWVSCVDSSTQDLLAHMSDICDFIEQMASSALRSSSTLPDPGPGPGAILVHCDLGISRSPTIIIAYLMRKYGAKLSVVLAFMQSKTKVKPSANFMRQLEVWEQVGYQVWEDEETGRTVPKAVYQAFLETRTGILKSKGLTGDEPLLPENL
ncbi:hypothetical protein BDW74DRAFT_170365 [Aspergillus multicolor]|uniref:dual specificity protein phosphatase family protein n=1 Tax=Aspergillus multicolor TaxID=41759 RepID=UPI003CCCB58C